MDRKRSLRGSPLHYGSALVVIAAEWLIYGVNVASLGGHFLTVDVVGALVALLGVASVEGAVAKTPASTAWLKALACALVVAYPLPTLGTALALCALLWELGIRLWRRHLA